LNVLLPARVGLGAPAFECSIHDFLEPQKVGGVYIAVVPVSDGLLLQVCAVPMLKSLSWCALPMLLMSVRASLA
jgi:hypothetical protein